MGLRGLLGARFHLDEERIGIGLGDETDDRLVGGIGALKADRERNADTAKSPNG